VVYEGPGGKLALSISLFFAGILVAQHPDVLAALDEASAAYQNGHAAESVRILETLLKSHPSEPGALTLMGAALDAEQRYDEAEKYYTRALKVASGSPQTLNNAANHYLAVGNRKRAAELYAKTVAIAPQHANANMQLAQMMVDDQQGTRALAYLDHLGPADGAEAGVLLLRARALALAGRCTDAGAILNQFDKAANGGAPLHFSVGMAQASCKLYHSAEASFTRALDEEPRSVEILYNLGLAALRAGHATRAQQVLDTALRERPEDVDVMFALAQVAVRERRPVSAAALLGKAEKLAPQRADVILLFAQVAAQLEFYEDSAAAYDRYLKLKPDDEAARRERGFSLALANKVERALGDLEWYVGRHPRDGMGFFELAIAQASKDREEAFKSLNTAIRLDPALSPARYARGLVNIEENNSSAAADDFRSFLEKEPNDYRALAHLGQAYLALDRPGDAAAVLERAVALAPDSPLALVQYRRALIRLGHKQEAADVLARLKVTGPGKSSRGRVGLTGYLNLPPADQRAQYLANLRESSAADPANVPLKMRLARELLTDGNISEALELLDKMAPDVPDAASLAGCGRMLLEFDQYAAARPFLESAVAKGQSGVARVDLGIVIYHLEGAAAALKELDKTPATDDKGDFYLLRAQLLDAVGKFPEATEALNRGIRTAPTRPELYLQSAGFLLKHKRYDQALSLLESASRILPDNRDLLLAQAVTLAIIPRDQEAQEILAKIQTRWPEWDRPYLVNGIILEIQLRSAEAVQVLDTAIALGANTSQAYYYDALALTHAAPDDLDRAQSAIDRALALTAKDPYVYLLAGKISIARKQYSAGIEQLLAATRLLPTLIPAHYALRDAYKAAGDEQRSAAEVETIQRIVDSNSATERAPFPVEDFVFTVRPPG
jgi:tetratricopeptide (TPR) repeat protein